MRKHSAAPDSAPAPDRAGGDARTPVSIISPFFPDYRTALFARLDASPHYSFTFVGSSTRYRDTGVPGLDRRGLKRFVHRRSRALPGGLVWQHGVISHVLRTSSRAIVLTGDAHHLSTWPAALLARIRGLRVLFWTHGWTHRERGPRAVLRNLFYRLASDLLLYGEYARSRGLAKGFDERRTHVISNSMGAPLLGRTGGTDTGRSRQTYQRWIVISRLLPGRGIASVITAAGALRRCGRHVDLTIVGDGPMRHVLETTARQAGVPVRFLGAIYDLERTGDLLRQADLCLSPERVGLAAIHAMSSGCPVATHANPARQAPEAEAVIDGITGVRFPYGDFEQMMQRSWGFVAASDPVRVAQACHAEVRRRWTPQAQADAIEEALRDSLTRGRRKGG